MSLKYIGKVRKVQEYGVKTLNISQLLTDKVFLIICKHFVKIEFI